MRKAAAILTGLSLSGLSSGADAWDFEIKSRIVQSLEASDNYQLAPRSPGTTYSSISNLIFNTVARTPTMRFAATTDLSYRSFFGPGGENIEPGLDYGTLLRAERKVDSLTTTHIGGFWRSRSASSVQAEQLEETGSSTEQGATITYAINGGFTRQLSARDVLTWYAASTTLEGSGSVTSNTDFLTTATWAHQINPFTRLSPTVQYESINYQDATSTELTLWKGWLGFDTQLSKRLSVRGSIGGVYITLDKGAAGAVAGAASDPSTVTPIISNSGSAADWVGDLLISYKFNNSTSLTFAAAQSVGPDSIGVLRKTDILGLVLGYRINRASFVSFSTDFSRQLSSTGTTDLYSAAALYGYELTRDWHMSLSYRFRHRETATSSGSSNSVFFVLSRDFTILPAATGGPIQVARDSSTALMASAATWAMTRRLATRY